MSLAIRTVRRLDEHSETKEVAGIRIDKGIPVPPRTTKKVAAVMQVLAALEVGESFVSHRDERDMRTRTQAIYPGRSFVGRPVHGTKNWRIWRVK